MTITDKPLWQDKYSFNSSAIPLEEIRPAKRERNVVLSPTCYVVLCDRNLMPAEFKESLLLTSIVPEPTHFDKALNVVSLSNLMFKNSRSLSEKELDILDYTFSRLYSKTPTRL